MDHKFSLSEKKHIFGVTFCMVLLSWASIKIVLPILPGLDDILKTTPGNIQLSYLFSLLLIYLSCKYLKYENLICRHGQCSGGF